MILIVKTGDTFEALKRSARDFEDWIRNAMGPPGPAAVVHDARRGPPPRLGPGDGAILTGSPDMVTERAAWMEETAAWLRELARAEAPLLGICFGHQLLAQALGGRVEWFPGGRELGTVDVTLTEEGRNDPLLGTLPASFPAHSSHSQTVTTLPPGAVLLARSALEPHHAFRVGPRTWGVQFHPEFTEPVMRAYVERHRDALTRSGQDADRVRDAVRPSPAGALLAHFAQLVVARPARP